jgi:hypothetical protein
MGDALVPVPERVVPSVLAVEEGVAFAGAGDAAGAAVGGVAFGGEPLPVSRFTTVAVTTAGAAGVAEAASAEGAAEGGTAREQYLSAIPATGTAVSGSKFGSPQRSFSPLVLCNSA